MKQQMQPQVLHAKLRNHVEGKLASPEAFDLRAVLNNIVYHLIAHGVH